MMYLSEISTESIFKKLTNITNCVEFLMKPKLIKFCDLKKMFQ